MKRVFIVINIILLFLFLFEGWRFLRIWLSESALSFIEPSAVSTNKLPPAAGKARGKASKDIQKRGVVLSELSLEREGDKLLPLRESFNGVIEKNLFHMQRREGAEEIKIEAPLSPLQKPKPKPIIMEGIVIIGKYKAAVIKDTAVQGKTGRSTRRVRIGDTIEDEKVIAIMEDRIVVKGEEGERVIKLHDSDKPQRQQITLRTEGAPTQAAPSELPPSPPPAP